LVSLDPQTPERMRDTLPIHHPHPLLSHFSRLHTTQRAQRRANLAGQASMLPHDKARPSMIDVAQKVSRTEVAIGNPEVTRLRPRLARLEEQRQHLADEAAMHAEWPLIIGRLEDVATKVHESLEAADWARKRDLIRTLVKRVEVAQDQVTIVFRIDPYLGDNSVRLNFCMVAELSDATGRYGRSTLFHWPTR
jgi:hypothetical protein